MKVPEISDVQFAFPAEALEWMPPMEEIPEEFKRGHTEQNKLASVWFVSGLPEGTKFYPKPGVDARAAVRAINATLSSYAPKHQHKEAAVAYMIASWFDKIELGS